MLVTRHGSMTHGNDVSTKRTCLTTGSFEHAGIVYRMHPSLAFTSINRGACVCVCGRAPICVCMCVCVRERCPLTVVFVCVAVVKDRGSSQSVSTMVINPGGLWWLIEKLFLRRSFCRMISFLDQMQESPFVLNSIQF